jgi:hypothetical protein
MTAPPEGAASLLKASDLRCRSTELSGSVRYTSGEAELFLEEPPGVMAGAQPCRHCSPATKYPNTIHFLGHALPVFFIASLF